MAKRGLVVAKYREDVSWLSEVPGDIRLYIYDKTGMEIMEPVLTRDYEYKRLDNEGHDPGTFLRHIVDCYEELDDWTVFVQGWPFDHYPKKLLFRDMTKELDYYELGNVVFNVVGNGPVACGNLELTKVFKEITGKEQLSFEFVWGMQVVLSRRLIHQRPKEFYEKLLARTIELYKDKRTLPLMERIWRAIWQDLEREL